jgi:hypothetical protein
VEIVRPPRFTPAQLSFALGGVTWGIGAIDASTRSTAVWILLTAFYVAVVVAHVGSRLPSDGLVGPALSIGAFVGVVGGVASTFFDDAALRFGQRLLLRALTGVSTGLAFAPLAVLVHLPIVIAVRASNATTTRASRDAILVIGGAWCALLSLVRIAWSRPFGVRAWTIDVVAPLTLTMTAVVFGIARARRTSRWIDRARRGDIEDARIVDDTPETPGTLPLLIPPKPGGTLDVLVRAPTEKYRVDARLVPIARVPHDPIASPVRNAIARHLLHVPIPAAHYVRLVIAAVILPLLTVLLWLFFTDAPHPAP